MCRRLDNPGRYGVPHPCEDDRCRPRCRHGGPRWNFANGEDHVHAPGHQGLRGCGKRVNISPGEFDIEDNVATLFQPRRLEAGPESLQGRRSLAEGRVEHTDGVTNLIAERLQPLSSVYPEARGILPSRHRSRDFR